MKPEDKVQLEHEGNLIASRLEQKIREERIKSGGRGNDSGTRQDSSDRAE